MPDTTPIAWPWPEPEHLPQGALRQADGSTLWRLWAPFAEAVRLVTWPGGSRTETGMTRHEFGYFTHEQAGVEEGLRYAYRPGGGSPAHGGSPAIDNSRAAGGRVDSTTPASDSSRGAFEGGPERPDPASRWQPDGVHKPSAVFYPETFPWNDSDWKGIPREELVIYELHVGTFTPEGTFEAVIGRLGELKEIGITAIEIMPVGQFPGERNWGYDGVHPFAAQNSYGGPRGLQTLVDAAHREGLAVLLDVVYNHLGPEGNYLAEFGPYFTDRYHTPWGAAVNYDGPQCDPVRRYVIDNACMWVRDFHVDGLRLDAVHAIFDFSARHILEDLQEAVQQVAAEQQRTVHVIAETNQNDVRQIHPPEQGGYGLDGVWNDDFHHSVHTILTGEQDGYYADFGRPEHLAKAFNDAFVYDGQYSPFRRRRHGSRVGNLDRSKFVVCIKNHDQIGNRARGDRPFGFEAHKLAMSLLMLSPNVPLVFMGDEYFERCPFPFFCSFGDAHLVEAVRKGRRKEFEDLEFRWGAEIPDPQDVGTFQSAVLSWQWPDDSRQARMRRLFADLLSARRRWPALRDLKHTSARVSPAPDTPEERLEPALLWLQRGTRDEELLACANLTESVQSFPLIGLTGGDRPKTQADASASDSDDKRSAWLSAPDTRNVRGTPSDDAALIFSTHEPRYGGTRNVDEPFTQLHPWELIVCGPQEWRL